VPALQDAVHAAQGATPLADQVAPATHGAGAHSARVAFQAKPAAQAQALWPAASAPVVA